MTITTIAVSAISAWGRGSTDEQLWMFVVAFAMCGFGYYGTARLLYGEDYWKR